MAPFFAELERKPEPEWVAGFDPLPLGSGGGTVHLLLDAWLTTGSGLSFLDWLRASRKLIVHSGGLSRRLPEYSCVGKALIPLPPLPDRVGQDPRHKLIDLQVPTYEPLLRGDYRVMVTSGDALFLPERWPDSLPTADVLLVGVECDRDEAEHFGVFVPDRSDPEKLDFAMQKPSRTELSSLEGFCVDSGIWLLNEQAVRVLFERCGVDPDHPTGPVQPFELYSEMGLSLGSRPVSKDRAFEGLSTALIQVGGQFLHFGTTAQLHEAIHKLTGTNLERRPEWTLQHVPILGGGVALRFFDTHGAFSGPSKVVLSSWANERGLALEEILGANASRDVADVPLYPILSGGELYEAQGLVEVSQWNLPLAEWWRSSNRVSHRDLMRQFDAVAHYRAMDAATRETLLRWHSAADPRFFALDLEAAAAVVGSQDALAVPESLPGRWRMHEAMFRAEVLKATSLEAAHSAELEAFGCLRDILLEGIGPARIESLPEVGSTALARCPLRLDLAGGWTDTPPYCLTHGGAVLNVAVDLDGAAPVEVAVTRTQDSGILLRSLDLGTSKRIREPSELQTGRTVGSEFALAQIGLHLTGFESLLAQRLGGIEVTIKASVPKGSGLGTSSILGLAILAALNRFCRHGWDASDLIRRTLAMEQILTTGGGWQDQSGALWPGMKLLKTEAGNNQVPTKEPLPQSVLEDAIADGRAMLYYTGITRTAKSVLGEIVRGMFLHTSKKLAVLREIGKNVEPMAQALRTNDYIGFAVSLRRTWKLKQELDSGTNPEAVQSILSPIQDLLAGESLLGAGGGGYLLLLAKDVGSGARIRETLEPSKLMRLSVSNQGLEVV